MRTVVLVMGMLCACAHSAQAGEPFGLQPVGAAPWHKEKISVVQAQVAELDRIAEAVRGKRGLALLGWVNQLVNLSPVLGPNNNCAEKAFAKCEVLRRVYPPVLCRYIIGGTRAGDDPEHAMAAAQFGGRWYMLDNQHVVAGHYTPTDTAVAAFRGLRVFRPTFAIKY